MFALASAACGFVDAEGKANMSDDPKPRYDMQGRYFTRCQADCDGECNWKDCPQIMDDEPYKTGRHCPLDAEDRDRAQEFG